MQDESGGTAGVDDGGAKRIRATNQFFGNVVLLGGAVSGDTGGLMFNRIAVHHDVTGIVGDIGDKGLLDRLVGNIELSPKITLLIDTFSRVFWIDNPLRFGAG